MIKLSHHAQALPKSQLDIFTALARKYKPTYPDLISLGVGEPHLQVPDAIKQAAKAAIDAGHSRYTSTVGVAELRELCAEQLRRDGISGATMENTITAAGAKPLLNVGLRSVVDVGTQVLLLAPYYPPFFNLVSEYGGVPHVVALPDKLSADFFEQLSFAPEAISGLIVNTPCNPSGRVLNIEELHIIAQAASRYGWWLIADETYRDLIYDDRPVVPLAALVPEQTLTLRSFSKSFCMTGWRLGYAQGPQPWVSSMTEFLALTLNNASSISQYAGIAALKQALDFPLKLREDLRIQREYLLSWFKRHDITHYPLDGAFYAFANFGARLRDWPGSITWATELLHRQHVAVTPGIAFGDQYDNYLRISYALPMADLKTALERIEKVL